MRLYRSDRFAVYRVAPDRRTHSVAPMHIVVYGDARSFHAYHIIDDPENETLVLNFLNEQQEDTDALLAAYVAMEEPYNEDRL